MQKFICLDWLEVFCNEGDSPKDPTYFRRFYELKIRPYGTPQYAQVFSILMNGRAHIEIRRAPYSKREDGGIFRRGSCHIRLTNFACYLPNPARFLLEFLQFHNYKIQNISRVDIASDFAKFDSGDNPAEFLNSYLKTTYRKINQCKISVHGLDMWDGFFYNSAKWGSTESPISTKLYNKSMEMKEVKPKPWIIERWQDFGFDVINSDIWRLEFAINSKIKNFVEITNGEFIPCTLEGLSELDNIGKIYAALTEHYFHFRVTEYDKDGNMKRKDRCKRKELFDFGKIELYKPMRDAYEPLKYWNKF